MSGPKVTEVSGKIYIISVDFKLDPQGISLYYRTVGTNTMTEEMPEFPNTHNMLAHAWTFLETLQKAGWKKHAVLLFYNQVHIHFSAVVTINMSWSQKKLQWQISVMLLIKNNV